MYKRQVLGCRGEPSDGPEVWLPPPPDRPLCDQDPRYCPPPPPRVCAEVQSRLRCDPSTGQTSIQVAYGLSLPAGFDQVAVTDPSGTLPGLPQFHPTQPPFTVLLGALAAGQTGVLQLCAYDSLDAASGKPYDCCTITLPWQAPATQCQQEAN